jgi:hypothetical protein
VPNSTSAMASVNAPSPGSAERAGALRRGVTSWRSGDGTGVLLLGSGPARGRQAGLKGYSGAFRAGVVVGQLAAGFVGLRSTDETSGLVLHGGHLVGHRHSASACW